MELCCNIGAHHRRTCRTCRIPLLAALQAVPHASSHVHVLQLERHRGILLRSCQWTHCKPSFSARYFPTLTLVQLFTALYYTPFYFMSVRGASATDAGKDLLPAMCLLIPGSIVVSVITSRLGRYRWAIWGGWAVTTLACGLFLFFDVHTSKAVLYVILAVFGIGTGMVLTSVNVGIQAISRPEDCSMAASMYGFFRSLGMPIGVAVSRPAYRCRSLL
jgi:MFS family permease